jgi:uridine kinase
LRHRQGRLSPDDYYEDARDLNAIRNLPLEPLGPDGDRGYVTQTFDLELDQPSEPEVQQAGENAVLIVDGTFLQRPELRSAWDFVIFLHVPEDEAHRRGIIPDRIAMGQQPDPSELYLERYGPAFSRYELECNPADQADVRIDN